MTGPVFDLAKPQMDARFWRRLVAIPSIAVVGLLVDALARGSAAMAEKGLFLGLLVLACAAPAFFLVRRSRRIHAALQETIAPGTLLVTQAVVRGRRRGDPRQPRLAIRGPRRGQLHITNEGLWWAPGLKPDVVAAVGMAWTDVARVRLTGRSPTVGSVEVQTVDGRTLRWDVFNPDGVANALAVASGVPRDPES